MMRMRGFLPFGFAAVLVGAVFAVVPAVYAADVQTLTVTDFTLSLGSQDHTPVGTNDIVHLVIRIHTREKLDRLNNVVLPDLAGFQTVGDEHTLHAGIGGTNYREVVTLSPQHPGTFHIGPASIEAINRRTGLFSRFSSQRPVTIVVAEADPAAEALSVIKRTASISILVVVIAALVFFAGRSGFAYFFERWHARRKPAVLPPKLEEVTAPAAPATPVPSRYERLRAAIDATRADPSKKRTLALRLALRAALGAHSEETLADLCVRVPDGERGLFARALRAAERAAFIDDYARKTAVEEGLSLIDAACTRLENVS